MALDCFYKALSEHIGPFQHRRETRTGDGQTDELLEGLGGAAVVEGFNISPIVPSRTETQQYADLPSNQVQKIDLDQDFHKKSKYRLHYSIRWRIV